MMNITLLQETIVDLEKENQAKDHRINIMQEQIQRQQIEIAALQSHNMRLEIENEILNK